MELLKIFDSTAFSKIEALQVVKSQGFMKGFMGHDKQSLLLVVSKGLQKILRLGKSWAVKKMQ